MWGGVVGVGAGDGAGHARELFFLRHTARGIIGDVISVPRLPPAGASALLGVHREAVLVVPGAGGATLRGLEQLHIAQVAESRILCA